MTKDQLLALSDIVPEFECDDKTYTYIAEVTSYDSGRPLCAVQWFVWDEKNSKWSWISPQNIPPAVLRDLESFEIIPR